MDTETHNYTSAQTAEPSVIPANAVERSSDDEVWNYDAFISYRRVDGEPFAAWLRAELESYRLPKSWPEKHRPLKVYLDKPFERASNDFWQENIEPALTTSRHLIVVITPAAYQPRGGGQLNWVEREIDFFTKLRQGHNVLIALVSGDFDAPLPGGLREKFPQITVVDMRAFRAGVSGFARRSSLRDHLLTLLAALWEIPDTRMPDFRQEERRRKRKRMAATAASLTLIGVLALAGYVARAIYVRTVRYQLTRLIQQAPSIKVDLGDDGTRAWADALALSGHPDEALAYTRSIVQEDERAAALAAVAERVAQRGDPVRGHAILGEALKSARQSPENREMEVYKNMISATRALTERGRADLATQILDTIKREDLAKVPEGNNRFVVGDELASAYLAADNKDAARQMWLALQQELANDDDDTWQQARLAVKLSRLGEQKIAMGLLESAERQAYAAERQTHAVDRRPQRHVTSAAEQYVTIARAYRILGMPDKQKAMTDSAIKAADRMTGVATTLNGKKYTRYFDFSFTAAVFARELTDNGRPDSVGRFAQREGEPLTRTAMLVAVVNALAGNDAAAAERYLSEVEQQARGIEDDGERAEALTDLASAASQLNDKSRASGLLDEALSAARKLPETYVSNERDDNSASKTDRLTAIALELWEIGRTSDADKIAHEADLASRHIAGDASYYLPLLCKSLAAVGDYVLARETAERATGNEELKAFAAVVREIARKLDPEVERLLREDERKWKAVIDD
jgi:tetratricopeptide (TPR) repeat protein